MTDFLQLSDKQIRKQVAQIAGYRVLEYNGLFYMVDPDKTIEQTSRGVDRNFHAYRNFSSEQAAWEFSVQYPDYANNLNACFLLYEAYGLSWSLRKDSEGYFHCIVNDVYVAFNIKTPALAMCHAFLVWNESN